MNRPRLTFVQRIGLELLWLLARAVAVMPYWVKYYVIENLLFVLLFYKYGEENLKRWKI